MRVILDDGTSIDLGETEATPTISLVDYSRRETDAFGVTKVVKRGFARRMTVKLIVPFDQADALQRRLAALRATAVQWVADEGSAWLNFKGFLKDFEIDLNAPPVSYCTLAVEGLTDTETLADDGSDPAPNGAASSLQLLQPASIDGSALIASNVPENDYPEWDAGTSYPVGARIIKTATHRIYESGSIGNQGNDPAGSSGKWTDIGPTNRWAMFDEALGSVTSRGNPIVVTLQAGSVNSVALLDADADTVRVETTSYVNTTRFTVDGSALFLNIPVTSDPVTVIIASDDGRDVSVGTLIVGRLTPLGETLESAKAGIVDYSRKEADEFGEIVVVERAWAKRVNLSAMIRTDAIDAVANRIAIARAQPSLWIGKDGLESITAYGFFKDFQIERDVTVSKLSLSIEGLSTAGKVEPLGASVNWPDIADPDGTKPEDNANYGAPGDSPVGPSTGNQVVEDITDAQRRINAVQQTVGDIDALTGEIIANAEVLESRVDNLRVSISTNLLSNSDFVSKAGWGLYATPQNKFYWAVDAADFVIPGEHYLGVLCTEPNGDYSADLASDWIAISPDDWVQGSCWIASRECTALIALQWADGGGNYIGDGARSEVIANNAYRGSGNLDGFKRVWCKDQPPSNARFVRMQVRKGQFLSNPANDLSWLFVLRPMIAVSPEEPLEAGDYMPRGGGAALMETAVVAAGASSAAAQLQTILAVDSGTGQSARVNTIEQAAYRADDRTSGARWSKEAVAGNGRAQLTVYAFDNNGNIQSGVDIIGDLTISGNLIVSGSIITSKIADNAVSDIYAAYSSGFTGFIDYGTYVDTQVLTIQASGKPVVVHGSLSVRGSIDSVNGTRYTHYYVRLYRDAVLVAESEYYWQMGAYRNAHFIEAVDYPAPGQHTYYLHVFMDQSEQKIAPGNRLLTCTTLKK